MTNALHQADQQARAQALDVSQSCMVRAPAGSGKTELLIQRMLACLAQASQAPEQVVAVTFTLMAAEEMRERLVKALQDANQALPLAAPHQATTRALAKQVLARDQSLGWRLLEQPERLCLLTLDALCAQLVRQAMHPAAHWQVLDQPEHLYEQAFEAVYTARYHDDSHRLLLTWFEGDARRLKRCACALLSKRDQWAGEIWESQATHAFNVIVTDGVVLCQNQAGFLRHSPMKEVWEITHPNQPWSTLWDDPGTASCQRAWRALANWLLTAQGNLKKRWTKREGIVAPSSCQDPNDKRYWSELKTCITEQAQRLEASPRALGALQALWAGPLSDLSDEQRALVDAMTWWMKQLLAGLQLVFERNQCCDFSAMAWAAWDVLGRDQRPTHFALAWDYRLEHLLVDEFQDTSMHQYRLLCALTRSWTPNDGRSFFAVGDPMQSIYRFRQAEVSLFAHVQAHGLGDLPITPLVLRRNFRSSAIIVNHVNERFHALMPPSADTHLGAVAYESCTAVSQMPGHVAEHWLACDHPSPQAQHLATLIDAHHHEHPQDSVVILLRSRAQLPPIVEALQAHNLPWWAHQLEQGQGMFIQDTTSLIQAIADRSDDWAWAALYRSAWIGLTLEELGELRAQHRWLSDAVKGEPRHPRLATLAQALQSPLGSVVSLAQRVLAQLMPAAFFTDHERCVLEQLWRCASNCEKALGMGFANRLPKWLERLRLSQPQPDTWTVQLMTIHQSKGLEFDAVFVPGLERGTPVADKPLLWWDTYVDRHGLGHWLMCPEPLSADDANPTAAYMRRMERERFRYERVRLLYVAATRARRCLHWLGQVPCESQKPGPSSALADWWSVIDEPSIQACETPDEARTDERLSPIGYWELFDG